eukprot:CAMPEP_0176158268 /NCGR_PEP_ID=MMETSP0120_2-20121206/80940_1 /TAXON_ID=160619 /ORGANISM="Kryptoperidinium foliaceum, Strain CCMP 1326" /LENGTH=175 /DNA_ID=CAMNT_0017495613 /DNA_START=74 /DNA_END=597 /DNA_ORIENTATION=+
MRTAALILWIDHVLYFTLIHFVVGFSPSAPEPLSSVAVVIGKDFSDEARSIASILNVPSLDERSILEEDSSATDCDHILRLVPFELPEGESTFALSLASQKSEVNSKSIRRRTSSKTKKKKDPKQKPFYIDFAPDLESRLGKRALSGGGDLLVKAVGPGKFKSNGKDGAIIVDLT